jgi:TolA-binding protein
VSARRPAVLATAAAALTLLAGCAYFNTFYTARQNFEQAESQMRVQTDPDARASAGQAALYDKAIEGATKVIIEYPKSKWVDDSVLMIGRSYLAKGQYPEAQEKFDELARTFPKSELLDNALFYSGVAAERDHRREEAVALYDSLLTAYPKSQLRDDTLLRRSSLFLAMHQPERAIGDLTELSRKSGKIGYDAGLNLAEALFAQHDYAAARAEFERVAQRAPTEQLRLDARLRAGDCDEASGNYAGAADSYLKLLHDSKTDDGKARARIRYGNALALSGGVDRGLVELKNVVDDYPRSPYAAEAMFRIGYLQEVVRDDFKAATEAYGQVAVQAGGSPFVAQARARSENLARLAETQSAATDTTAANRAAETAYRQAEHYLFQLAKPERALEEFTRIEHDYPQSPLAPKAAFARVWVLARRLNQPAAARAAYDSLVTKYPGSDYASAAQRVATNPSDSTAVLEALAGTTMQVPLVPGNQIYVPPPPQPAARAPRGATGGAPARVIAKPDSLAAKATAAKADSTTKAKADSAGTAKADSAAAAAAQRPPSLAPRDSSGHFEK